MRKYAMRVCTIGLFAAVIAALPSPSQHWAWEFGYSTAHAEDRTWKSAEWAVNEVLDIGEPIKNGDTEEFASTLRLLSYDDATKTATIVVERSFDSQMDTYSLVARVGSTIDIGLNRSTGPGAENDETFVYSDVIHLQPVSYANGVLKVRFLVTQKRTTVKSAQ